MKKKRKTLQIKSIRMREPGKERGRQINHVTVVAEVWLYKMQLKVLSYTVCFMYLPIRVLILLCTDIQTHKYKKKITCEADRTLERATHPLKAVLDEVTLQFCWRVKGLTAQFTFMNETFLWEKTEKHKYNPCHWKCQILGFILSVLKFLCSESCYFFAQKHNVKNMRH